MNSPTDSYSAPDGGKELQPVPGETPGEVRRRSSLRSPLGQSQGPLLPECSSGGGRGDLRNQRGPMLITSDENQ